MSWMTHTFRQGIRGVKGNYRVGWYFSVGTSPWATPFTLQIVFWSIENIKMIISAALSFIPLYISQLVHFECSDHISTKRSIRPLWAMHITVTHQNGPDKTVMDLKWSFVLSTAGEITDYSSRETKWLDSPWYHTKSHLTSYIKSCPCCSSTESKMWWICLLCKVAECTGCNFIMLIPDWDKCIFSCKQQPS